MIRLRDAQAGEVDLIRDIERRSAVRFVAIGMAHLADDQPIAAETLAQRIAAGGLMVAAEADDVPVAFVMFRPADGWAYVEQIDVLPSHAGRRIGAGLLDAVAERARTAARRGLMLSTFKDVAWNAPYYRRIGFVDVADHALSPAQTAIRAEHVARGLDETRRVFMVRAV
ncbi:MAG: acetyltransferase, family [Caulobacter sp.]|nr:acetyltransferase, family [Caulobacter sp.]